MTSMQFLNLGCGDRWHPEWCNLDVAPVGDCVQRWDVRMGVPASDQTFRFAYLSHLLEHLRPREAEELVRECWRVLAPGGVVRVVVPDLERIARDYLDAVERERSGERAAGWDREWMTIELLDQCVRERSGGRMGEWLSDPGLPNEAFVRRRIGREAVEAFSGARKRNEGSALRGAVAPGAGSLPPWRRARRRAGSWLLQRLVRLSPEVLAVARFRESGEVHHWLYDELALSALLERSGFRSVRRCAATESALAGWLAFGFDSEADGAARKPDSLYMEATRP